MEFGKPSYRSVVREKTKFCSMCSVHNAKYTCPRCTVRTCSLQCCKSHKTAMGCSGKRNPAAFVSRKDYGYFSFLSDYRFLESLDRDNEYREKKLTEIRNAAKNRRCMQSKIANIAGILKINYRLSSSLLTRARMNRTHLTTDKPQTILWTLEFCLIGPSVRLCRDSENLQLNSDLRPIHLLLNDCPDSSLISDIWQSKVVELSSAEQEALAAPELAPTSATGANFSVTGWVLPLNERLPFFYIECVDRQTKSLGGHEEIPPSNSLLDVLKRGNYVVNEFPRIWVSQANLSS